MLQYRKTGNIHTNGEEHCTTIPSLSSKHLNSFQYSTNYNYSNQHINTAHDAYVYFESEEGHYNANYQYKLSQITASQQSKYVNLEGRKAYQHR